MPGFLLDIIWCRNDESNQPTQTDYVSENQVHKRQTQVVKLPVSCSALMLWTVSTVHIRNFGIGRSRKLNRTFLIKPPASAWAEEYPYAEIILTDSNRQLIEKKLELMF